MERYAGLSKDQKRKFWQKHTDTWEKSGLSLANYCRLHNISQSAFTWRKRSFEKDSSRNRLTRIPIEMDNMPRQADVRLELVINKSLSIKIGKGFAVETLQCVLKALGIRS